MSTEKLYEDIDAEDEDEEFFKEEAKAQAEAFVEMVNGIIFAMKDQTLVQCVKALCIVLINVIKQAECDILDSKENLWEFMKEMEEIHHDYSHAVIRYKAFQERKGATIN